MVIIVCVCAAGAEQARGGAASSKLAAGSAGSSWQGVGARLGRLQQVSSTLHGCFVCILGYYSGAAAAAVMMAHTILADYVKQDTSNGTGYRAITTSFVALHSSSVQH